MCGIIGYVGPRDISSVLLSGLWKLEYRGYDSAGVASIYGDEIHLRKVVGKLHKLAQLLDQDPLKGNVGIGHTRWATHGEVSPENAHPQIDCDGKIAVVHNGIIENYISLRNKLRKAGHILRSSTDTEIIPHLIEEHFLKTHNFLSAIKHTVELLEGSFAIAIISLHQPDRIFAVRKGSPLVVGWGETENILASDIQAIVGITRKVSYLEDDDLAILTANSIEIENLRHGKVERQIFLVDGELWEAEKEGYPFFMLKEIHEQPRIVERNIRKFIQNRTIKLFDDTPPYLHNIHRIIIQACGTSWHAGYVGKYILEEWARIYTDVEIASEFRYRAQVMDEDTMVMAISQSGETADTLAGIREAKLAHLPVLSLVNVPESSIARESTHVLYINAGPEIGVASTKAYTAQLLLLYLFALYLKDLRGFDKPATHHILESLETVPSKMARILDHSTDIVNIATKYMKYNNFMFLGRWINYPSALEGALKLKEISYIHAIGYPAGEMKHGPLALVDENMPVVVINPYTRVYDKMCANIEEVKSRKGKVIGIATEGDTKMASLVDDIFYIPEIDESLTPLLVALPLQLLAYHIAVMRGLDVDKPRNLAKSVTVE